MGQNSNKPSRNGGLPVEEPLRGAKRAHRMTGVRYATKRGVDSMNHSRSPTLEKYPHGRGYGHDYMRGGEVLGGYGYAEREEYERRRGEITGEHKAPAETDSQD